MGKLLYTKEFLQELANQVTSMAQLINLLGYKRVNGGAYTTVKKYLALHSIVTGHWTGSAWNSGTADLYREPKRLDKAFRSKLILTRGSKCEKCGLTEWYGEPGDFEIHHIDEDPENNRLDNLQILCLHCHAKTKGWRNKGKGKKKACADCGDKVRKSSTYCNKCKVAHTDRPVHEGISKEDLEKYINVWNMTEIGRYFGVSRVTIRKYLIKYDLYAALGKWQSRSV